MLRSFLRVGALGTALTSGVACHLLLEGQDLGGSGAGATGDGGQGGQGMSTGTTLAMSTTGTGTTDQASSTGVSATGGCVAQLGLGDGMNADDQCGSPAETDSVCNEETCAALEPDFYVHNFNLECAHGDWCRHLPGAGGQISRRNDGTLFLQSNGLTGWWQQGAPQIEFPTYVYRTIAPDFDFVFATRIASIAPTPGNYNVAGIVIRDPVDATWEVGNTNAHWVKLEYGRRGSNVENYRQFGVLLGEGVGEFANQEGGEPGIQMPGSGSAQPDVGLAVCRIDGDLTYFYDLGMGWSQLAIDGQIEDFATIPVQVGLTVGALYNAESMEARFDWANFLVRNDLSMCDCLGYLNEGMDACAGR